MPVFGSTQGRSLPKRRRGSSTRSTRIATFHLLGEIVYELLFYRNVLRAPTSNERQEAINAQLVLPTRLNRRVLQCTSRGWKQILRKANKFAQLGFRPIPLWRS